MRSNARPIVGGVVLLGSLLATANADDAPPVAEQPAAPATPPAPSSTPQAKPEMVRVVVADSVMRKRGISPDLDVLAGLRAWDGDSEQSRWWTARVRVGALIYNEPNFLSVGLAGQFSPLGSASLGVDLRYVDLWRGFWLGGGVYPLDTDGGVSYGGALGYALFGVEYQRRVSGDRAGDQAISIMLQLPIGIVRVARRSTPTVIEVPASSIKRSARR